MREIMQTQRKICFIFITLIWFEASIVFAEQSANNDVVRNELKRFNEILIMLSRYHFQETDYAILIDAAINGMISTLDCHSTYRSGKNDIEESFNFENAFAGIGLNYHVVNNIPLVLSPAPLSSSSLAGLQFGDYIMKINEQSTYGLSESEINKLLRGKDKTLVDLSIRRNNFLEAAEIRVLRQRSKVYSVYPSFMIDSKTAYIGINRLARTTSEEFVSAVTNLKSNGMEQLILDIRGNTGGYLDQAIELLDHIIDGKQKLCHLEGKTERANTEFYSSSKTLVANIPLIVLISHGTASGAELIAGSIQDLDRGLIVGETSLGIGFVQNQLPTLDKGYFRLTTAQIFLPSGRPIINSLESVEEYNLRLVRYSFENNFRTSFDSSYKTKSGRIIDGGCGISPDIPINWNNLSLTVLKLFPVTYISKLAKKYIMANQDIITDFDTFNTEWQISEANDLQKQMIQKLDSLKIQVPAERFELEKEIVFRQLKYEIANQVWDQSKAYEVYISNDPQISQVIKLFPESIKIQNQNSKL